MVSDATPDRAIAVDGKVQIALHFTEPAEMAKAFEALAAGGKVTLPRGVTVPADFAKALKGNADARKRFDELSQSRKQWFVLGIEGAKTEETRERRIHKAIKELIS
jgi:uncharacterized protein YdeI (YjbR/CyaY-like superfamily)